MERRKTRQVLVRDVPLGGGAPVAVQSMTKAPAGDVEGTLKQIREAKDLGCDIIRCAIPTIKAVDAFAEVVRQSPMPVVADIHFDARIALAAIQAGADKVRINPGNMDDWEALQKVLSAARERGVPIRIGVNSGSVRHRDTADSRPMPVALAEAALGYAERFEELGFNDIVLSLKSPDPLDTIAANREAARRSDYPLHLGVTAAGPREQALLKSAIGIGALLADGIGDTIRLSFTGPPRDEVVAGRDLLRAAGLLDDQPVLISCPTCGRCRVDLQQVVEEVKTRLATVDLPIKVAVMGCEVNGPGEAKDADLGIASAGGQFVLFVNGERIRTIAPAQAVDELLSEVRRIAEERD